MAVRIMLSRKLGELRMTQAELSRRTGIRTATICEIYNELCERVNLEHLDRICTVLNCDLSEILVYDPPKNRDEALELYKQG
jgi:putative transcriptional regulator